jgi:uncharacterized protein YfaP (DUF2135 family)
MNIMILLVAVVFLVATDVMAFTGKVVKIETGACTVSSATFKRKEWVDLNEDGKPDFAVTTWCDDKVTVSKAMIVSGTWPTDWRTELDYHTVASNGADHVRFVYRDVATNMIVGTESIDSMHPSVASLVFYSHIKVKPNVSDPLNQEPEASIEIATPGGLSTEIAQLSFETYEPGDHSITVTLREHVNSQWNTTFTVKVDSAGKVIVPYIVPEGSKIVGFSIGRPGPRQQHDYIGR